MINRVVESIDAAVADVPDGATVLVGGFGGAGSPTELIHALIRQGAKDLTLVSNNAGNGHIGLAALLERRRVRKVICSFPRSANSKVFDDLFKADELELETVPQGTLAERIRAAGAGLGGFYTPTTVGTPLAEGKERKTIDGVEHVLELALKADVALVKAELGDRWGNLTYRMAARNFGPVMCTAARTTVVQVRSVVPLGQIHPEQVVTPGVFVDRIVEVPDPLNETEAMERGERFHD